MFIIKNIRKAFSFLFPPFIVIAILPEHVTLEPIDLGLAKLNLENIIFLHDSAFWFVGGIVSCGFVFSWGYYLYDKFLEKNSYQKEILMVFADCSNILQQELLKMSHNKVLAQQYLLNYDRIFNKLLSIPEVSHHKVLNREISNAKGRFLVVVGAARDVCHDKEKIARDKQSNLLTIQGFKNEYMGYIKQFDKHKKKVFKLCERSLLGVRY